MSPTIKVRRDNLISLLDQYGGPSKLGRLVNIDPGYLGHIRHNRRGMGDKISSKIESALGLDKGWLDKSH